MKRSEINGAIGAMIAAAERHHFVLPPFAHWTPADWREKGHEYDELRAGGLGWDVTDFGQGDFARVGLTLLTIRNGLCDRPSKPYCEKLMLAGTSQLTPMHFHHTKTEDIINRGGGRLVCEVYQANEEERLSRQPVRLSMDGRQLNVAPGTQLVLEPGQSITLTPRLYHAFWAAADRGAVLLGEVSSVNDDRRDNRFLEPLPRFPGIEEDEPPLRLLCHEHPPAMSR